MNNLNNNFNQSESITKNIIIIGAGIAGYTAAVEIASEIEINEKKNPNQINLDHKQINYQIIIIEKNAIGGTCLNKGCIPTKAALHITEKYKQSREINNENNNQITEKIRSHNQSIIAALQDGIKQLINAKKIAVIQDDAVIESENTVLLKNANKTIPFDYLIIATGSTAIIPEIYLNEKNDKDLLTSDAISNLSEVPQELIIVGGGYIGVECATIFHNLGSKITIIEKMDSFLGTIDQDAAKELENQFKKKGIQIITGRTIIKLEENIAYLDDGQELLYDKILVAIGRAPVFLESKIIFEKKEKQNNNNNNDNNIKINNYFETNHQNMFIIGDATANLMLAHKAEYDAKILAKYIIQNEKIMPDYSLIPMCIFSDPQIAIIGNTAPENKTIKVSYTCIGKSYCLEAPDGFLKLFLNEKKQIIGAVIVHKYATEILTALTIIINKQLSCEEITKMIFMHPTLGEIIKEAAKKGCQ